MKITCNRRDDILRRKAAYEEEYNARKSKYEEQRGNFRNAEKEVTDAIENEVSDYIGDASIDLQIKASPANFGSKGWKVQVSSYENDVYNSGKGLSWNWSAALSDDGSVIKESGSWSGLQATTVEQIESLKEAVRVLELLNNADWKTILSKAEVNYSDYITEDTYGLERNKPNFDLELKMADVEDAMESGNLIAQKHPASTEPPQYFKIIKQTPKRYTFVRIPKYNLEEGKDLNEAIRLAEKYPQTMDKEKFLREYVGNPVEILEV